MARSVSIERLRPSIDWIGVWLRLRRWRQLARERRQLALLDEAALKDLGLSRADILQESERPFWDDPLAKPGQK